MVSTSTTPTKMEPTMTCLNSEQWADGRLHNVYCSACAKSHYWLGCEKKISCPDCKFNLLEYGDVMICGFCHKCFCVRHGVLKKDKCRECERVRNGEVVAEAGGGV